MATRTAILLSPMVGFSFFLCGRRVERRRFGVVGPVRSGLGGDDLVEPAHFALAGFEAQLMELTGVAVDVTGSAADGIAKALAALLHLPPPTLEDAHARLRRGAAEEGEVHAEAVVGVVLRTRVRDEFREALLARGGHAVALAGPPSYHPLRPFLLGDEAVGLHAPEARVEQTVRERPEGAE